MTQFQGSLVRWSSSAVPFVVLGVLAGALAIGGESAFARDVAAWIGIGPRVINEGYLGGDNPPVYNSNCNASGYVQCPDYDTCGRTVWNCYYTGSGNTSVCANGFNCNYCGGGSANRMHRKLQPSAVECPADDCGPQRLLRARAIPMEFEMSRIVWRSLTALTLAVPWSWQIVAADEAPKPEELLAQYEALWTGYAPSALTQSEWHTRKEDRSRSGRGIGRSERPTPERETGGGSGPMTWVSIFRNGSFRSIQSVRTFSMGSPISWLLGMIAG